MHRGPRSAANIRAPVALRVCCGKSGDGPAKGAAAGESAEHPRLDTAAIQTVGTKGWDGFAVARVT